VFPYQTTKALIPSSLSVRLSEAAAIMVFLGILTYVLIPSALCGLGAFFVANTICQNRWKEKIPSSKLAGFATIFTIVFATLGVLLMFASATLFRR
jgi:hypothetical protein